MNHLHSIAINFSRATSFGLFILCALFAIVGPFLVYLDFDVPVSETGEAQLETFILWSLLSALMFGFFKQYFWVQLVLLGFVGYTYMVGKAHFLLTSLALILTLPAILFLVKQIHVQKKEM